MATLMWRMPFLFEEEEEPVISSDFTPFHVIGLCLYPLKISGFLMFSGGIEREHWHEMG